MKMLPLTAIRLAVLWILLLGVVGTGAELLLLGHTEDAWQWQPLVMFGVGLPVLAWHAVVASTMSRRACVSVMAAFVASGLVGQILHYRGNVEFELEMVPALGGRDLFQEAMAGATPVLAPGTMSLLGLLGILYALLPITMDTLSAHSTTARGTDA